MDAIFPVLLAVFGANMLTLSVIYGGYRLSKITTDGAAPGDVIAAFSLPLLFLALGVLAYA
jgi:hypothetical protein